MSGLSDALLRPVDVLLSPTAVHSMTDPRVVGMTMCVVLTPERTVSFRHEHARRLFHRGHRCFTNRWTTAGHVPQNAIPRSASAPFSCVLRATLQTLTLAWSPDSTAFIANDRSAGDGELAWLYQARTLDRLDLRSFIVAAAITPKGVPAWRKNKALWNRRRVL